MPTYKNILVALDFQDDCITDTGVAAAEQAAALAKAHGARLTFAHVLDISPKEVEALPDAGESAAARHVRTVRDALAAMAASTGAHALLLFGTHWRELVREVQRQGHDLVVLGTKRRSVAGRMLYGSTGSKLLRTCPCPVWVVKQQERSGNSIILVAHDMTSVGEHALRIGAEFAAWWQTRLHVIHVLEHPEARKFLGSVSVETHQARIDIARQELTAQCAKCASGLSHEIEIRDGNAYAEILDYLRAQDVHLLVMGTVARAGLAGLLTGNTAENVLPWADCSVVVIKPGDFTPPASIS
jgi:universal stress protein E